MKHFLLEQFETEIYTSHSGFAQEELCLNRYGKIDHTLKNPSAPQRHRTRRQANILCWIGFVSLLCVIALVRHPAKRSKTLFRYSKYTILCLRFYKFIVKQIFASLKSQIQAIHSLVLNRSKPCKP